MQSICTLLPAELASKVVEARALLAGEPSIGAIYDPPFAHFTLQLAEDYEWEGLAQALADLAAREEPFEARTLGLLLWGESGLDTAVIPHLDERLVQFQSRVWQAVSPFAIGNVRKMDTPGGWIPHITVKRGGTDQAAIARCVSSLVGRNFAWTFPVDNITVQHDPGKNSRTHYQRYRFPLRGVTNPSPAPVDPANATTRSLSEEVDAAGARTTIARAELDGGGWFEQRWSAPELVRVMAAAFCSDVYFAGARCRVENGAIRTIEPVTPFPIQA